MIGANIHLRRNHKVKLDHFGLDDNTSSYSFSAVEISQAYGIDRDTGLLAGASVTLMVNPDAAQVTLELAEALREAALRFLPEPEVEQVCD